MPSRCTHRARRIEAAPACRAVESIGAGQLRCAGVDSASDILCLGEKCHLSWCNLQHVHALAGLAREAMSRSVHIRAAVASRHTMRGWIAFERRCMRSRSRTRPRNGNAARRRIRFQHVAAPFFFAPSSSIRKRARRGNEHLTRRRGSRLQLAEWGCSRGEPT